MATLQDVMTPVRTRSRAVGGRRRAAEVAPAGEVINVGGLVWRPTNLATEDEDEIMPSSVGGRGRQAITQEPERSAHVLEAREKSLGDEGLAIGDAAEASGKRQKGVQTKRKLQNSSDGGGDAEVVNEGGDPEENSTVSKAFQTPVIGASSKRGTHALLGARRVTLSPLPEEDGTDVLTPLTRRRTPSPDFLRRETTGMTFAHPKRRAKFSRASFDGAKRGRVLEQTVPQGAKYQSVANTGLQSGPMDNLQPEAGPSAGAVAAASRGSMRSFELESGRRGGVVTYSKLRRVETGGEQDVGGHMVQLPSAKALGVRAQSPGSLSGVGSSPDRVGDEDGGDDEQDGFKEGAGIGVEKHDDMLKTFYMAQRQLWKEVDEISLEEDFD